MFLPWSRDESRLVISLLREDLEPERMINVGKMKAGRVLNEQQWDGFSMVQPYAILQLECRGEWSKQPFPCASRTTVAV
jgi:hypothetical protein